MVVLGEEIELTPSDDLCEIPCVTLVLDYSFDVMITHFYAMFSAFFSL